MVVQHGEVARGLTCVRRGNKLAEQSIGVYTAVDQLQPPLGLTYAPGTDQGFYVQEAGMIASTYQRVDVVATFDVHRLAGNRPQHTTAAVV